jgi:hypothetical protein
MLPITDQEISFLLETKEQDCWFQHNVATTHIEKSTIVIS